MQMGFARVGTSPLGLSAVYSRYHHFYFGCFFAVSTAFRTLLSGYWFCRLLRRHCNLWRSKPIFPAQKNQNSRLHSLAVVTTVRGSPWTILGSGNFICWDLFADFLLGEKILFWNWLAGSCHSAFHESSPCGITYVEFLPRNNSVARTGSIFTWQSAAQRKYCHLFFSRNWGWSLLPLWCQRIVMGEHISVANLGLFYKNADCKRQNTNNGCRAASYLAFLVCWMVEYAHIFFLFNPPNGCSTVIARK